MKRALVLAGVLLGASGCNCSGTALTGTGGKDSGTGDGGSHPGDGGSSDAGHGPNCTPTSPDLTGCLCAVGQQRNCYPSNVPHSTDNVGPCHDGTQTCVASGEIYAFGPCTGAVTPTAEAGHCTDGIDNDCNGKIDCQDPSCANDPACNTGCTAGQTRPCYDGPAGTEGVGTCRDGVQTCDAATSQWGVACNGEVLPATENCGDALDHNCNGLPGCFDFFACLSSPLCSTQCNPDAGPGCSCPSGEGDTATCAAGTVGVSGGGFPGWFACCPCTTSDCSGSNAPVCCAESICAGNAACGGLTCHTLPASCNGQVNQDCDDVQPGSGNYEDCDEPCCPCTACVCPGLPCTSPSQCCSGSCTSSVCDP
jgi:hypothetical protein